MDLMAASRTTKPRSSTRTPRSDGRRKSRLTTIGEEAAKLAKRQALLATLDATGWDLSKSAELLELASNADVIRAIKDLDLTEAYEAAKSRGDIVRGRKPGT